MKVGRCDFHMHTFLSDGELLPIELIRRAAIMGHRAVALTDHASFSNIQSVVEAVSRDCEKADAWNIEAIPGVEITHVPVRYIDEAVRTARKAGAQIVVVHGESPVEPVEPGTNHAAVSNPEVDILAHPGMIDMDDASLAARNEVFLEITCRRGHSLTNGHVATVARASGAKLLVNTDAHSPSDLSSMSFAESVALGAGLSAEEARQALVTNPDMLLERLGRVK
ncbi:MAG: histidinol phosphate phosphatase domain-containing protein [Thermoplasmata archaeon]|nr:histidinol phosphate phosphatase domain-containing protein [Thermoplasmata archaeon]